MTKKVPVGLSIVSEETDGYSQATDGDNNAICYWYLYSGGTDGHGNVKVSVLNEDTDIEISLDGASNGQYDLKDIAFKSNGIGANVPSKGPNKLVINDPATTAGSASYSVIANPQGASNPDIYCDPMIENDWPEEVEENKPGG